MAAGLVKRGFLDPERCWKEWNVTFGSLQKVRDEFARTDTLNPKTGRPPTNSAIEKSAFSWAIHNPEEAKRDLVFAWQREGFVLKDEDFKKLLVRWAKLVYRQSHRKFSKFIAKNGLQDYV